VAPSLTGGSPSPESESKVIARMALPLEEVRADRPAARCLKAMSSAFANEEESVLSNVRTLLRRFCGRNSLIKIEEYGESARLSARLSRASANTSGNSRTD